MDEVIFLLCIRQYLIVCYLLLEWYTNEHVLHLLQKRKHLLQSLIQLRQLRRRKRQRRYWQLLRSEEWWRNMLQNYSDAHWLADFRMTKATFQYVVSLVRGDMEPDERAVRSPIPTEKRVAIAIFQLASMAEFRVTGEIFGVSAAAVSVHLRRFCRALEKYLPKFISLPSPKEARELALLNEMVNHIPQVYGAIDGSHIEISPPAIGHADYINRKRSPSLILQAVVDFNYRFRNINIRMPGSCHDAAVLRESGIYRNSDMLPKEPITINGVEIPLLILGDAAYPDLWWLMRPYVGRSLPQKEISFNVHHSSSRMVVENAFGRLKGRWRCLRKAVPTSLSFVPHVITTCCILHNICEESKSPQPVQEECVDVTPSLSLQSATQSNNVVRDTLRDFLWEMYPPRTSSRY